MKTLRIYEIGVDELPVEGSCILVFDSRNSFNMFDQHYALEGEVVYMYGDIANGDGWCETLEEALEAGGYIETNPYDIEDGTRAITIDVDAGQRSVSLVNGSLWMYAHEYYMTIANVFPFQEWSEYQIAKEQGWIKEVEYVRDDEVEMQGQMIRFDKSVVEMNGKRYSLKWAVRDGANHNLMEWVDI